MGAVLIRKDNKQEFPRGRGDLRPINPDLVVLWRGAQQDLPDLRGAGWGIPISFSKLMITLGSTGRQLGVMPRLRQGFRNGYRSRWKQGMALMRLLSRRDTLLRIYIQASR